MMSDETKASIASEEAVGLALGNDPGSLQRTGPPRRPVQQAARHGDAQTALVVSSVGTDAEGEGSTAAAHR